MRYESELTKHVIQVSLHGYGNNILSWLETTVGFFEVNGYPLKSVSYDINFNKIQRKSLKIFYKQLKEEPDYPVDKLYSFTVFAGVTQKYPDTWYYGCIYNEPDKMLSIFFDTSFPKDDILSFYKSFLKVLLKDKEIWIGYLFNFRRNNMYPYGGWDTLNYYKEAGKPWGEVAHRLSLQDVELNKNMYRHIYKQNILSKHHIEEKIDGIILTEWIDKNNYGTIEKIGKGNWLWIVPEEKLHDIQVIFYNRELLLGVN